MARQGYRDGRVVVGWRTTNLIQEGCMPDLLPLEFTLPQIRLDGFRVP
jgi:hypothetical protein